MKSFYLKHLTPRLVYIPYALAVLLITMLDSFLFLFRSKNKRKLLGIEAGIQGWEIIEYKELFDSAVEYLGISSVQKVVIHEDKHYLEQVKSYLELNNPTHYAYSPRTGRQNYWGGMLDAFGVVILCHWYRVIPIVFLTDLPIRLWRAQSSIITARKGLVVSLMSPRLVKNIFPHKRIIGPYLMPFSNERVHALKKLRSEVGDKNIQNPVFIGSLYEPRTSTLKAIKEKLVKHGINFEIKGRILGGKRITDEEYWLRIVSAPIVLTTSDQLPQKGADWPWLPHFVYRYSEVLACGSLLMAPEIEGIDRYFTSGVHYVSYKSIDEAIEKMIYYLHNKDQRKIIATQGHERMKTLVEARSFWLTIDVSLGIDSLK